MGVKQRILSRFEFLYQKKQAPDHLERLEKLFDKYGFEFEAKSDNGEGWDYTDTIIITYGDVIQEENGSEEPGLKLLESFLDRYLQDVVSTVHILPFFPSSSDAGFSVIDYKKVREGLGSWDDVERLASDFKLMADLVINHTSRYSNWFENYEKGESPGKDYFIEVDEAEDFTNVTRPRNTPLITSVQTEQGLRHVWTTFSDDQIDLDFRNPEVLFEFIDIFLFYVSKGIQVIRLDAVAYIWKEIGTPSIHLEETHQIVKLFRDIADCIDSDITLITETNVPFEENISYFGNGDEAQMIYQFSLPPLLLHAILTENAAYLTEWAAGLKDIPEGCTFFNFTASHDGIGVRPLEGLIPDKEFDNLVESMKDRGGFVSYKSDSGGGQTPYELNITYFDAFEEPGHPRGDLQMKRFMCSQIIAMSLQGVPGIYFHNFTATKNNLSGVLQSGHKRDINRKQWDWKTLTDCIEDRDDTVHCVLYDYKELLLKRKMHPAFHPLGGQNVIMIDNRLFAFVRTAPDKSEKILIISNVTSEEAEVRREGLSGVDLPDEGLKDILSEEYILRNDSLTLSAFQTVWLLL